MIPALRRRISANLSMLFTELPLRDRFAAARAAGFEAVEIQFPYDLDADELRRAAGDAKVSLVLFNVAAGDLLAGGDGLACVPGAEAAFGDALAQALDYVAILEPRCLNLLAGRVPDAASRGECERLFVAHLARASAALVPTRTQLVVEPLNPFDMPRFLLSDHDQTAALLARSGTRAKVQYDVYHQARIGRDPLRDLGRDAASIAHIQFADVPARTAPGTGELDFGAIFEAIAASDYGGFVGAEYKPNGPTEPTLEWFRTDASVR